VRRVFRVKPLETLMTAFDQPLVVDIEVDRLPATIEAWLPGETTPFNTLSLSTVNVARWTVWTTNPIASSPTGQVHSIIFKVAETGETMVVNIAYVAPRPERVNLIAERGVQFAGTVVTFLKLQGKVFWRVMGLTRFSLIDVADHASVFHEFTGVNEFNDKFYYVDRQDRILEQIGSATDLNVTLKAFKGSIPVTVSYDIPALSYAYNFAIMLSTKLPGVITGFIGDVTEFIIRFPLAVARFISRVVGLATDVLDARVEDGVLKATYAVDAPPLTIMAIGVAGLAAGAVLGFMIAGAITDIVADVTTTITAVTTTNAVSKLAEERTKAVNEALEYARAQALTPEQTEELLRTVLQQYDTGDIVKVLQTKARVDELEREASRLRRERIIFGVAGAGAGAIMTILLRGR